MCSIMLKRIFRSCTVVMICSGLIACNENDHDNFTDISKTNIKNMTIVVTPSLGKINNAKILLTDAKSGVELTSSKNLENGIVEFTLPTNELKNPILVSLIPNTVGDIQYFDEATNKLESINISSEKRNKPILRAMVSVKNNVNIAVTALTEAAVQRAEKMIGGLTEKNIDDANKEIKNQLKITVFDTTQALLVLGTGDTAYLVNNNYNQKSRLYAAYLATLAKEAKRINPTSLTPAYNISKSLADDFAYDGVFNGIGSQVNTVLYNDSFIKAWTHWEENFYNDFLSLSDAIDYNIWFNDFNSENPVKKNAVPLRTINEVEEYSCQDERKLNTNSDLALNIDLVNNSNTKINIYLLDTNKQRQLYKMDLTHGESFQLINLKSTSPLIVTNNLGECLGIYVSTTSTKKILNFDTGNVVITEI